MTSFALRRPSFVLMVLGLCLVASLWLGLAIGTTSIHVLAPWQAPSFAISLRMPRVVLAAMAGGALSVAGLTFQALLRNPLADPYIVGVSSGAALGGVLALVLQVDVPATLPAFAFTGAMGSAVLLFGVARARGKADPLTLLLVGVIFNAFAAAVVTFFKLVVSPQKAQEILYWLVGFVGIEPWETLGWTGLYCAVGLIILWYARHSLDILTLGDDQAASLGLPVERARLLCFLAAALLVGAVVSVAGMIGFVGLVVPHILRLVLGASHRLLLPAALLGGAAFLVLADALARASFQVFSTELPVGVITAFTGGPFFLFLLLRRP